MPYLKVNTSINEIGIDKLLRCNYRTTIYKNDVLNIRKKYDSTIRLKSIFNIISGYAFSSKDYVEEGIPIVRIGDLNNYSLNYENMIKVPQEYYEEDKYKNYIVKKDDILVSLTGDGNLKCLHYNDNKELLLNQRVAILRAKSNINIEFYYWLLKSDFVKKQFAYYSNGKSQLNISPFDLANINIPVIDEKLQNLCMEKISPIIRKIKNLSSKTNKTNEIINKVFAEKFNYDENLINDVRKGMTYGTQSSTNTRMNIFNIKFETLNKNMRLSARANSPIMHKIYDILNKYGTLQTKHIVYEKIRRGKSPDYDKNGIIPVLKTAHITNNGISKEYDEFVNEEFYNRKSDAQLKVGDILLASTGKPSIGKIDIFEENNNAIPDGHISIIRIDTKKYNRYFFVYFIRSVLGYTQIEKDFVGCTNQIELYPDDINEILIPNISLEEQQKIVNIIDAKFAEQNEIKKQISIEQIKIEKILSEINFIC